jgi:hypothetical protein
MNMVDVLSMQVWTWNIVTFWNYLKENGVGGRITEDIKHVYMEMSQQNPLYEYQM